MNTNSELAKQAHAILTDIAAERHTKEAKAAYSILVEVAKEDDGTIGYEALADQVGVLPRGRFSGLADKCLHPIAAHCVLNGFPDITCLVVRDNGFPSPESGFNRDTVHLTWAAVRALPWPTDLE